MAGLLWVLAAACVGPTGPGDRGRLAVSIGDGAAEVRQGDVVAFTATVRAGGLPAELPVSWSVGPATAGFITGEGRFVGYTPGPARIVATVAGGEPGEEAADTVGVTVLPREGPSGSLTVVGHGPVGGRFTSDLWVVGGVAYTGSWGRRDTGASRFGDRLYVWDVRDPSAPAMTDSVSVDARTVNDVKVRSDGSLAVLSHEFSTDGLNGITLLDLTDPLHPAPIVRFTEKLHPGVHNVWIEGEVVYAVSDGGEPTLGSGLQVIDVSDPSAPRVVASFYGGSSFLHDVYVRDGLAFLSHWDAGLIILDVGNGIAGGGPGSPVEVSRVQTGFGNVHSAWYWPAAGYVFVGEEDFQRPGVVHVVDVRELRRPKRVATYAVPGETPHNFWLDEGRAILYVAWYTRGVLAVDVSGELLGELDRQGREIASLQYDGAGFCQNHADGGTCSWAPQLHAGLVFVSDMNSGLWVLRPDF